MKLRPLLPGLCFLLWSCDPPASGGWRSVASTNDVHESAGALVLRDGRALVIGGHQVDKTRRLVDTVELYDAAPDRWTTTAPMLEKREGVGALQVLLDGRVLLAGEHNTLTGSELFDPATETWSATGPLNVGRGSHVSALLDDGRVLVAGGINWLDSATPCFDSAELYDPVSGRWALTTAMANKRMGAGGLKLADGRVMAMGGFAETSSVRYFLHAEIFDPKSATWTQTAEAPREVGNAGLVALRDGRVLRAGGVLKPSGKLDTPEEDISQAGAELYDPATDTWSPTGSMLTARSQFPLLLLADGRVLAVGGVSRPEGRALSDAEIFDPATGTWSSAGRLGVPRWNHAALRLGSQVLVIGGYNASGQLSSVEANDRL